MKKVKFKRLPRLLGEESLNQKVLLLILKSAKITAKGLIRLSGFYFNPIDGFDAKSIYQKFYGTYYANKEESRIKEKIRKEWEIKRSIKRLQSMDYIKINEARKKVYLTEKGFLEFIKFRIHDNKGIWDSKWRMIIFDIPEKKRQQRDFLRKQLKWLGFKELQKSVWIFPYDIRKDVEELLSICKPDIGGDIRFLTTEKIDSDKDLREYFNL